MKENAIIFVDATGAFAGLVVEAAARNGHAVWMARAGREAFELLQDELPHAAALVVDLDAGGHGFAVLEAVNARRLKPAVIALTSAEEAHMAPVAKRHGAAACLGKPFSVERLARSLREFAVPVRRNPSCDLWGHPLTERQPA